MSDKISKVTVTYTDGSEEIMLLRNVHSIGIDKVDENLSEKDLPEILGVSTIHKDRILSRTTFRTKIPNKEN
jgi:hypothetical protein